MCIKHPAILGRLPIAKKTEKHNENDIISGLIYGSFLFYNISFYFLAQVWLVWITTLKERTDLAFYREQERSLANSHLNLLDREQFITHPELELDFENLSHLFWRHNLSSSFEGHNPSNRWFPSLVFIPKPGDSSDRIGISNHPQGKGGVLKTPNMVQRNVWVRSVLPSRRKLCAVGSAMIYTEVYPKNCW